MVKKKKKKGSGGLVGKIKDRIKKSGANKGKFVYFKAGIKNRVRFLQEMDQGFEVPFHDSFQLGINSPCQEVFDRDCDNCDNDDLRHRDLYAWSVYDYEAKETRILMAAANSASPVPALVGMYEAYGTIMDRDYIITREGTGTSTTYSVVPMDKVKFKNKKAKPFSESKFYKILDKAYPNEEADGKEEEWDDDEENEEEYDEMEEKELYKLCKKRGIKCKPKKGKKYYINLLEEDEEEADEEDYEEEEDEEEDDDDVEEEEEEEDDEEW